MGTVATHSQSTVKLLNTAGIVGAAWLATDCRTNPARRAGRGFACRISGDYSHRSGTHLQVPRVSNGSV